ncbi:MAG: hypothetical protein ABUL69_03005, partial [Peristeroidobacter soli]
MLRPSMGNSAALALLALPSLAAAAQWGVVPQLSLIADSDSNRRLQEPERPSDGAVINGLLSITRETEVSTLALKPRASVSRYSGDDALDSEDWGIDTLYRFGGERLAFDVRAGASDDSTLITELGETGFVDSNTRRHSLYASTSLTQYLGVRHRLRYQASMTDVDYDRTLGTGLVGYHYPSIGLLYASTLSPRFDITFSLDAARLEVPLTHVESDTRGAQAGFRFRVSENFDLEARAGRTHTQARGRSDVAQSYFASASWHDERQNLDLTLSQDVQPSGNGILVHADDLRVAWSYRLTERLTLDSSARATFREDTAVDLRRYSYRYGAAQLAFGWRCDENWTMSLAGGYVRQEYELRHGDA